MLLLCVSFNVKKALEIVKLLFPMECSSMFSLTAFVQGGPGSNPGWFTVSISN